MVKPGCVKLGSDIYDWIYIIHEFALLLFRNFTGTKSAHHAYCLPTHTGLLSTYDAHDVSLILRELYDNSFIVV